MTDTERTEQESGALPAEEQARGTPAEQTPGAEGEALSDEPPQRQGEALTARIAQLEGELKEARRAAARADAQRRGALCLRRHGLDETLLPFLLPDGETDTPDGTLDARAQALSDAIERAARRSFQENAAQKKPAAGGAAPLSGEMIRQTPVARLAELM